MQLNKNNIVERIRDVRKAKCISQETLCEMIGKNQSYISRIERGAKGLSLETFIDIANALQVSPEVLLIDELENTAKPISRQIESLLSDCTDYESLVMYDLLKSIKESLRTRQAVLEKWFASYSIHSR